MTYHGINKLGIVEKISELKHTTIQTIQKKMPRKKEWEKMNLSIQ